MTIATFALVALDCADPRRLADFYQGIVGGEIDDRFETEGWIRLRLAGTTDLAFQHDPDHQPPQWPDGSPQQAHMDFDVVDLEAGEEAVMALGAVKADVQPSPESWRVFIDPAGHPFCLVKV